MLTRRALSAVLVLATITPVLCFAQRPAATGGEGEGLAVWLSHTESDNVARTPNGDRGSWQGLGILANLDSRSSRFNGSLSGEVEHRWYSIPDLDDEWVGSLNALADIQIVRNRFSWNFEGDYGQSRLDALAPVGPSNRDSIITLTTGPQLSIPFGARTVFSATADYTERRYDKSTTLDSESRSADIALSRRLNETTGIGLFAEREKIGYDESTVAGHEIDTFGLRYDRSLASGSVFGEVGKNEISYQNQIADGPFLNFTWNRDLTARSHLSVMANREYTDFGSLFASTNDGLFDGGSLFQGDGPFESRRVSLDYTLTMTRTTAGFVARLMDETYAEAPDLDNEATGVRVYLERTLSQRMRFDVAFEGLRRTFTLSDARGTDRWAEASFTRAFGRQLELSLILSKYDVDSLQERSYEFQLIYWPVR